MQPIRLAVAIALVAAVSAPAQQRIPLGFVAPDDVHFYVHGLTSRTPDPGWVALDRAVAHLVRSRVHEDVIELATLEMRPREQREVRRVVDEALAMLGRVDWKLLLSDEVVFTYRIGLPMPEYVYAFRVPGDGAGDQAAAMRQLFAELARMTGLGPDAVRDVERANGEMTLLESPGTPIALATARVGDVLLLSTSPRMLAQSMKRLAAGDGAGALVASERFRRSMQHLPEATESVVFVDVHGIVDLATQVMRTAGMAVGAQRDAPPQASKAVDALIGLVEELDVVDHLVAVTTSDGARVATTTLVRMRPDAADSRFMALFADRRPWRDWARYVPADATSFWFDPGLDPVALHDLVTQTMAETVGGELAARAPRLRQVLSHVSGEMAGMSLPPDQGDGCAFGESVLAVRLEDPEGVSDAIGSALDRAVGFLRARGQGAEHGTSAGLHTLALDAFPWMRPTVGVRGDVLVFATSPAAVERIGRVARGEAPSIRETERFRSLGLRDADAVDALAFAVVEAPRVGFPDLLSGAGFFLSMLPEEIDTRAPRLVGRILTKLAPAARELSLGYVWGCEELPSPEDGVFLGRTVSRYGGDR